MIKLFIALSPPTLTLRTYFFMHPYIYISFHYLIITLSLNSTVCTIKISRLSKIVSPAIMFHSLGYLPSAGITM